MAAPVAEGPPFALIKVLTLGVSSGILASCGPVRGSEVFLWDVGGEVFVKLLDFGLAQRVAGGEPGSIASQHCAGTPPYMSPEQIVGGVVDGRSDLWSLGAMAFQCLTGQRPFEGETLGAVTLAIHTLDLPRPTAIRPDLPAAIDAWFLRACARAPEDRFPGATSAAEEMARALEVPLAAARVQGPMPSTPGIDRTVTGDFALARPSRASTGRLRLQTPMGILTGAAILLALGGVAYRESVGWSAHGASPPTAPVAGAGAMPAGGTQTPSAVAIEAPPASAGEPSPRTLAPSAPAAVPRITPLASQRSAASPSASAFPPDSGAHASNLSQLPDERN